MVKTPVDSVEDKAKWILLCVALVHGTIERTNQWELVVQDELCDVIRLCVILKQQYYYYFDTRIYLNLSKSTQSAVGLKALKPAANGHYLMCKSLPYYLHYRSTLILLSIKCMLGLFLFP